MAKLYTRTGDQGFTRLGDGSQIAKNNPRIAACGDVDELNAHLGLLLSQLSEQHHLHHQILKIQHRLFGFGAELGVPGKVWITGDHTAEIEVWIDQLDKKLPVLKEFILPGGTRSAAQAQVARAVCRRAERQICELLQGQDLHHELIKYINRLSDYLFVVARTLNHDKGKEITWQKDISC